MSEFYGEDFYELQDQCASQSIGDLEREITRLSYVKTDLNSQKNKLNNEIKNIDKDISKTQNKINMLLLSLKRNFKGEN